MHLLVNFVRLFFNLKMKSKTLLLFVCYGYVYGVLLVNFGQGFPAVNNSELGGYKHQNTAQITDVQVDESKLLSLMDITMFIDKNFASTPDRGQKKRRKRSMKESQEMNAFDENFDLDYETIRGMNLATNKQPNESPQTFQNSQENANLYNSENSSPNHAISSFSTEIGPPGTDGSNIITPRPNHGAPQYMLDLFARFQNDPFSQPASNIVRSFFNEG